MSLKILAIGDIHLGRKPSRLPSVLHQRTHRLSPQAAWEKTIDLAIRESVNIVVMLGDVVESDRDYFEALPIVQKGVSALAEHHIPVLMICGNHDAKTLPDVAQFVDQATLLGADEQWESYQHSTPEGEITFWGWSFAQNHYANSPLETLPAERNHGLNIGLLHCDRDQSSRYAPVTSHALKSANMDVWLLGHIHQPDPLDAASPSGYLGTLCGLDAGEYGPRGPWMMHIEAGRVVSMTQRPLAPIRWERIAIEVNDITTQAEARQRVTAALQNLANQIKQSADQPEVVGLRLCYRGACDLSDTDLEAMTPKPKTELVGLPGLPAVDYFIERLDFDLQPTLDLTQLAQRQDQPGLLAQYLLQLDRPADDPARQQLLDQAMTALADDPGPQDWSRIDNTPPQPEQVAKWLRLSGQRALRAMLKQQAG